MKKVITILSFDFNSLYNSDSIKSNFNWSYWKERI